MKDYKAAKDVSSVKWHGIFLHSAVLPLAQKKHLREVLMDRQERLLLPDLRDSAFCCQVLFLASPLSRQQGSEVCMSIQ